MQEQILCEKNIEALAGSCTHIKASENLVKGLPGFSWDKGNLNNYRALLCTMVNSDLASTLTEVHESVRSTMSTPSMIGIANNTGEQNSQLTNISDSGIEGS